MRSTLFPNIAWDYEPICIEPDGVVRPSAPRPAAILPGSFHPLHRGHLALARVAAARLGVPVSFELSITNVDKPNLADDDVHGRLAQFAGVGSVWVTRAATFVAKAALFPGAAFVVGFDTATRLVDPKYYRDDASSRNAALRTLATGGCRVVVGGRMNAVGVFQTWTGDGVPGEFADLFLPLAEADFREDVSSTALRG